MNKFLCCSESLMVLLGCVLMMSIHPAWADTALNGATDQPQTIKLVLVSNVGCKEISGIIPCQYKKAPYLLGAITPNTNAQKTVLTDRPSKFVLTYVNENTSLNIASLALDTYDDRCNTLVVNHLGELFIFFGTGSVFQATEPVVRHSPGGWSWQSVDTVEPIVRRLAVLADLTQGKVVDGMGSEVADLAFLKDNIRQFASLVDLGCSRHQNWTEGFVGIRAESKEKAPSLPYAAVYWYSATNTTAESTIKQLGTVKEAPQTDPDNPTLASKAVPGQDDVVTFGKPIADGKRTFYWYCIQQKGMPNHRTYILAFSDGVQTTAIDGYIVNPPYVRYWKGNTWVKEQRQLESGFQLQLGLPVQPVVGKDANGKIISYRPPELWQLEVISDADKAQQKDAPAGIQIK